MLTGAHKKFYRIQHPEIYLLDLKVQYKHKIKGISEIKNLLFCNCHCAFNSLLLRCIKIFYFNLIKAIKFALKVIDMNRPAPNLQLGFGNEI